jgi:hypothetical protein
LLWGEGARREAPSLQSSTARKWLQPQLPSVIFLCAMEIAGIEVDRLAVLALAERLSYDRHTDTAALLLIADAAGDERVGLSIKDREAIIDVLGDAPDGLAELSRCPRDRTDEPRPREHGLTRGVVIPKTDPAAGQA